MDVYLHVTRGRWLRGCSYVFEIVKGFHGTPLIDPQPLRKRQNVSYDEKVAKKGQNVAFVAKGGGTFACYEKLMAWWMLLCFGNRQVVPWNTFG